MVDEGLRVPLLLLALLFMLPAIAKVFAIEPWVPRPNVILIISDALRPDHLQCMGYGRQTAPAICSLSEKGTVFENAVSAGTSTTQSLPALFTSTPSFVSRIRVQANPDGSYDVQKLPDSFKTLTQSLKETGYETYSIQSNRYLHVADFSKDFDVDDSGCVYKRQQIKDSVECVDEVFFEKLRDAKKPYFFYLHYMDTHGPYVPPPRYEGMFYSGEKKSLDPSPQNRDYIVSQYDGEIRYFDDNLRRLLESVDLKDTVLIFSADHGEGFGEHGRWEHGEPPYQEFAKIPLIIAGPGIPDGLRIKQLVSNLDLYPTIAELASAKAPHNAYGRSLLPLIRGDVKNLHDFLVLGKNSDTLIMGGYKLLTVDDKTYLFNLRKDPGEKKDLKKVKPKRYARMSKVLKKQAKEHEMLRQRLWGSQGWEKISPGNVERLKQMGYLR